MKRNYTLTTSDAAQKALDAYRVRLSALDSAAEKQTQAAELESSKWCAYRVAVDTAKANGEYSRFAKQTGDIGDLLSAYTAACADREKTAIVTRAIQESAHRAATAYIGQMIAANSDLIDGTPTTYKCFKDFLSRVVEPLDRVSAWTACDGRWIQVSAGYASGYRYITIAGDDGIFSAEDMPTMPDYTGADPSAIYAAADAYADIKKQVEAARDAYKAQIAELKDSASALGTSALDDLEKIANI